MFFYLRPISTWNCDTQKSDRKTETASANEDLELDS